jgi:hypothetical protein
MQGEPLSGPFFGVFDPKGWCIAVGQSSADAVEVARQRLNLSTVQEVMNRCSVVHMDRDAGEQGPQP